MRRMHRHMLNTPKSPPNNLAKVPKLSAILGWQAHARSIRFWGGWQTRATCDFGVAGKHAHAAYDFGVALRSLRFCGVLICFLAVFFAAVFIGCAQPSAPKPSAPSQPIEREKLDELYIQAATSQSASDRFRAYYSLFAATGVDFYLKNAAEIYEQICNSEGFAQCFNAKFYSDLERFIPESREFLRLKAQSALAKNDAKTAHETLEKLLLVNDRQMSDLSLCVAADFDYKKLARYVDLSDIQQRFWLAQAAFRQNALEKTLKLTRKSTHPELLYLHLEALLAQNKSPEKIAASARELTEFSSELDAKVSLALINLERADLALFFARRSGVGLLRAQLMLKNYAAASEIFRQRAKNQNSDLLRAYSQVYALLAGDFSAAKRLDVLIEQNSANADVLNTYGYYLIDNDIDSARGVELVRKALKSEPENAYYMDSLAWGLFRLGRCQQAQAAINRALEIGVDKSALKELKNHLKEIKKCKD